MCACVCGVCEPRRSLVVVELAALVCVQTPETSIPGQLQPRNRAPRTATCSSADSAVVHHRRGKIPRLARSSRCFLRRHSLRPAALLRWCGGGPGTDQSSLSASATSRQELA